jgi:hypothetical protein
LLVVFINRRLSQPNIFAIWPYLQYVCPSFYIFNQLFIKDIFLLIDIGCKNWLSMDNPLGTTTNQGRLRAFMAARAPIRPNRVATGE